ncbi:MAG: MerR family transcriptional regulator [Microbacterium sp.]
MTTLQMISEFARAVGLSPSALRQYGESGLIAPAAIEERTGYRYYSLDQQQRAIWIRRLRDAGLRLDGIREILDSAPAGAEALLDDWVAAARDRATAIEELTDDLKLGLRASSDDDPLRRTTASFDAAVLASAVRRLHGAGGADHGFENLLVELRPHAATVVATDRYVLLARLDIPAHVDGPAARVSLPAADLLEPLTARRRVELVIEQPLGRDQRTRRTRVCLHDPDAPADAGGRELALEPVPDRFPDARRIIDAATRMPGSAAFPRDELLALVAEARTTDVRLMSDGGHARLEADGAAVGGTAWGPRVVLALSRPALTRILEAAVGEETICDFQSADRPVLWRASSQPDFAAMLMPRAPGVPGDRDG